MARATRRESRTVTRVKRARTGLTSVTAKTTKTVMKILARTPVAVVAFVLIGASAALGYSPTVPTSHSTVFPAAPAFVEVPDGGQVVDAAGRPVPIVGRETGETSEVVRLTVLEPGRYGVVSQPGTFGGQFFPTVSSFAIVGDVLLTFNPSTPGNPVVPGVLAGLAVALGAAAGAGRTRRRLITAGSMLVVVGVWGWIGMPQGGMSADGMISASLGLLGFVALVASRSSWPTTLPGTVASAVAAAGATIVLLAPPGGGTIAGVLMVAAGSVAWVSGLGSRKTRLVSGSPGRWVVLAVCGVAAVLGCTWLFSSLLVTPAKAVLSPPSVEECARRVLMPGFGVTVSPEGLSCYQALGASIGAVTPPSEMSQRVVEMTRSVDAVSSSTVCRHAGMSMATAAARWNVAGRANAHGLFTSMGPVCDYAPMHGIAEGVATGIPDDQVRSVLTEFCNRKSPDPVILNDYEFASQCWQGVGLTLARLSHFDPVILAICADTAEGGKGTCPDGFVKELVDAKARARLGKRFDFLPEGTTVESTCPKVPDDTAAGCYRYYGEDTQLDTGDRWSGLKRLKGTCRTSMEDHRESDCWYAAGLVATRAMVDSTLEEIRAFTMDLCLNSGSERNQGECMIGAVGQVIGSREGAKSSDLEYLCSWFPDDRRTDLCEVIDWYIKHLLNVDAAPAEQQPAV